MKKKIFPFILSLILVVNAVLPEMGNVFAQEASYDYEKVTVTNPVSNSYHVTTGTTGDGGPDWAFDGNAATHWHSNYTSDVTEDGQIVNTYIGNLTLGTVDTVPEYADVSHSRAWIGGEFEEAVQLGKFTYQSRTNKNANWIEQWALYTANVTEGTPADSDFTQAATGTWSSQSQATVKLDVPVTATHFRLVVFTAHNGHATASEIQMYKAIPADTTPGFGGSIVDTDTHYTQDRFGEVKRLSKVSESLTSWKNDKAVSEIVLYAQNAAYENVTVTAGDLGSMGRKLRRSDESGTGRLHDSSGRRLLSKLL